MQLIRPGHLPRRTMIVAASIIVSLAGTSCGGSDSVLGPGLGSGTLTASGAVTASGSGLALFQSVSSGGTNLFQILIAPVSQSTTSWQLQIANYSGRLPEGTYNLSALSPSSPDPTASLYYTSGGTMRMFNSTSGQLVITSSSASSVRGTFTFTATDPEGGTGTVIANGTFNAQCAPGLACL